MALPPDPNQISLDNQDDPLGGMDPLAWLESLARRQGVDPNQLTTDADLDIPMPDADAVVDGPGYTPGYDMITPESTHIGPPPVASVESTAPEPEVQPPVQPAVAAPAPAAEIDPMSDPLAWLESLARRQGVDPSQLTTNADMDIPMPAADAVVDGPGYTPGYDLYPSSAESAHNEPTKVEAQPVHDEPAQAEPAYVEPPAPEPVMAAQEQVPAAAIDPMSDPIAFMESLARNMGADPSQFTTKADLKIERPPEDAVVDGPGYTPGYDLYPSEPEHVEPPAPVQPAAPPPVVEQPAASAATQQPLISTQPDLPPQRPTPFVPARPSPFVPAAPPPAPPTSPVSAPAPLTVVEPVTQQPAAIVPLPTPPTPPSAPPVPVPQPVAATTPSITDLPDISDPLAWLESLTTPHPTSSTDFSAGQPEVDAEGSMTAEEALAWLEQLTHDNQPSAPLTAQDQSWLNVQPAKVDEAGGLSNDMDEIQRWLTEQAGSLGDLHDLPENDISIAAPDEPAKPINLDELPDWLRAQEPGEDADADNVLALSDSLITPPIPSNLPDWLMQNIEQPVDDQAVSLPILPAQEEEYDPWIAALEEEETRQQAGDDSLPDWYTEALARHGALPPALEATTELIADQPVEPVTEPADVLRANDLPSWLSAMAPDDNQLLAIPGFDEPEAQPAATAIPEPAEPEPAFEDEIPAWLRDAAPTLAETVPLAQLATPAQDTDLPDWLRGSGEATLPPPTPEPARIAQPERVAVQPPPAPIVPPQPVTPPPVKPPEPVVASADFDPNYHLQQAKYHASQQNYKDSLAHYQTLIDKSASLDDVIVGVKEVVAAQPKDPRARRLLGDAHLRQGNLQEALDTYRSALNNM